jgi:hypothetical protein
MFVHPARYTDEKRFELLCCRLQSESNMSELRSSFEGIPCMRTALLTGVSSATLMTLHIMRTKSEPQPAIQDMLIHTIDILLV